MIFIPYKRSIRIYIIYILNVIHIYIYMHKCMFVTVCLFQSFPQESSFTEYLLFPIYIYIYIHRNNRCMHTYISINKPFLYAAVVSNLFTFFHRLIYIGDKNNIYMCMHVQLYVAKMILVDTF